MFHKTTPNKQVTLRRTLKSLTLGVLSMTAVLGGFAQYPQTATAAVTNNTVNFQARLEGAGGSIAADGFYNVQFKLYSVDTAGTALWTESYFDTDGVTAGNDFRIKVVNGYLTANLGSRTAFPNTINWDQDLYITMNIGGTAQTATPTYDGEMNPRLRLTGVPYAFRAGQLAQFNQTTGFTSTLSLLQPTVGNQAFQLADQGAAGTYTLCIQGSANCGFAATSGSANYIQNGTTQQASSNFNISGTGILGTLSVTNNATVGGTLTVTGISTLGAVSSGAITTTGNFSQTGATTFGTGTGGVSLNGATNVTGSNAFTVGTGLASFGGNATVTGTVNSSNSRTVDYTSITGVSNDWFPLFTINDFSHGTVLVNLKSYAHSSVSFTVGKGFGASNASRINILNASISANGGYANVTGIRVLQDGTVEARFTWSSGPLVNISAQIIGTSGTPAPIASLATSASASPVVDTVSSLSNGLIRSGGNVDLQGVLQTAGTTRLTNTGLLQNVTNADASTFFTGGTLANARLVNSGALTVTAGTGLTGGGSIALGGTSTLSLANTAVTIGTYGNSTSVGQFTVDQQGRITGAASVAITGLNSCTTCVSLQATTPGTAQTGNINVSGTIIAGTFSGNGSLITNLNATNITTGTINDAQLSTNVALLNGTQTFSGTNTFSGVLNVASASAYYYGGTGSPLSLELSRTTPVVVNDFVEIGNFNIANGAHNIRVSLTQSDSGFSVAKTFILPIYYNATNNVWESAVPTADTGQFGGQDIDLDINVSLNTASLRLRRTAGTTVGTTFIRVESVGKTSGIFTSTSVIGTAVAPTALYGGLYQNVNTNNVGVGTTAPTQRLDVQGGNINTSGSILTGGTTRITNTGLLQNVTNADAGTFFTAGTLPNTRLVNSGALTVTAGTGLSGGGSVALGGTSTLNLANTAVTIGTYGSSTSVGQFTVDQQGRITTASNVAIAGLNSCSTCVTLQTTTPGTPQTGNINVSGTIIAGSFSGNGSLLTNLDAGNLATGTVNTARIAGSYTGITGTGALSTGSIASGFGTIATGNTITGTTINGTTGINTGAGAGTQRIDASGNLLNIGNITGSTLAVTGAPTASASASLVRIGAAIAGGNAAVNGGTYIGLNAPATGAGSTADFLNFQLNGAVKLKLDNAGSTTQSGTMTVQGSGASSIAGTLNVGGAAAVEKFAVGGAMALQQTTVPTATAGYGKLYVSSVDNKLHFVNSAGVDTALGSGGVGGLARTVKLIPEYAGGTIRADGTNNGGFMTSDFVSGLTVGQGYKHNYYEWSSTNPVAQDYDIIVNTQIPSEYVSSLANLKIWGYSSSLADATATIQFQDVDGTNCYAAPVAFTPGTASTWAQATVGAMSGCVFAANDIVTITIKVSAANSSVFRVGEVEFGYSN